MWNEEFTSTMTSMGFTQLKTDYCCFIQWEEKSFTIMIVWVDDILFFSNLDARNDQIEADLKSKFEVNTIKNPSMILGIKLIQKPNQITLSQTHFIDSLLKKFALEEANPVTTPLDPNVNLNNDKMEDESNNQSEEVLHGYATLIGYLMYLALGTQPDIAYAEIGRASCRERV